MKKSIYSLIILIFAASIFKSCQQNDYEVGDIVVPTNVNITAEIIGVDADNPYGDGSGFVVFKATANNAASYQFDFGDGRKDVNSSGIIKHRFTKVGINDYSVVLNATGTGGVGSSKSINITVFSSFSDIEAEAFLTGAKTEVEDDELVIIEEQLPSSKKWYWQADKFLHVGLGPVTDDYGNGEFAYEAWWSSIGPWDTEKYCMYNNEFVFTRTTEGVTFEQTIGPAFVPGTYAGKIGVDGDQCHDESVATTMFGLKNVTIFPSDSKAATEGTYNGNPYRQTSFEISDGGFMGWYVGASTYDIISISNDELIVRIIEKGNDFAWYHRFTSTKPVEGGTSYTYNNLVWEDDFNTDGAPDTSKWTYDIGTGTNGWGNNESQYYTDRADNVKVEGGNLVITAKKEAFMGSEYTSARLKTEGLYDLQYGRVEIKAQLPQSAGTWPALWMLGANFSTVGWPHSGEIDILEQTGDDKANILATTHWYDDVNMNNASYSQTTAIDNSSQFHVYTMEWTQDTIKIYLDDVMYYELANNADLPFNQNFFLIFNVAMGGTLGGTIDSAFTEDSMIVDYIKVYQ